MMRCKYRTVLAIDGGGIRGIIPLTILNHFEKTCAAIDDELDMTSWIDVFSGTSTGAIISGALMLKDQSGKSIYNSERVLDLYLSRGKQIFSRELSSTSNKPAYPLKLVLENNFGEIDVNGITKHFLFVSYDLNANAPFIFTDTMDRYRNVPLAKVMMACCAIPGYFPPVKFGEKALADGILTAKNPSKLAYEYAKMFYPNDPIIVISLGTGALPEVKNDLIEKEMTKVHTEMIELSKTEKDLLYFRFQPELLKANSDMDDTSAVNLKNLTTDAHTYIKQNQSQFDRLFKLMSIRADQPQ